MVEKTHQSSLWPSLVDPLRAFGTRVAELVSPASEASSDGNDYTINVELPGVDEADITLSAHDGALTLKGEKRVEREESGKTWYFSERQYGAFSRSFRLPPDADDAKVRADLKDGVLTIRIPKRSGEDAASRKVAINVG